MAESHKLVREDGIVRGQAGNDAVTDVRGAAELAGVAPRTIRGWMARGLIEVRRLANGHPRIVIASLYARQVAERAAHAEPLIHDHHAHGDWPRGLDTVAQLDGDDDPWERTNG